MATANDPDDPNREQPWGMSAYPSDPSDPTVPGVYSNPPPDEPLPVPEPPAPGSLSAAVLLFVQLIGMIILGYFIYRLFF